MGCLRRLAFRGIELVACHLKPSSPRARRHPGLALGFEQRHVAVLQLEHVAVDALVLGSGLVPVEAVALDHDSFRDLHEDQSALDVVLPVLPMRAGRQFVHPSNPRSFDGAPALLEHLVEMLGILGVVRPVAHPAVAIPRPRGRGIQSLGLAPLSGHFAVTVDGFSSIGLTSRFVRHVVGVVVEPCHLASNGGALHALIRSCLAAAHLSAPYGRLKDFRGNEVALDALAREVFAWAWHQRAPRSSPRVSAARMVRARSWAKRFLCSGLLGSSLKMRISLKSSSVSTTLPWRASSVSECCWRCVPSLPVGARLPFACRAPVPR